MGVFHHPAKRRQDSIQRVTVLHPDVDTHTASAEIGTIDLPAAAILLKLIAHCHLQVVEQRELLTYLDIPDRQLNGKHQVSTRN
jgi:hypothetical protein